MLVIRTSIALLVALALLVATPTAAHAKRAKWSWQSNAGVTIAWGQFFGEQSQKREVVFVSDRGADGHSALLKWRTFDGKKGGSGWDHTGSADPYWQGKVINVREGKRIRMKLCTGERDGRRILRCQNAWVVGRA